MKRQAAVLIFARLTNYGVMLLSPLFLVRLLSVDQFGAYREFMLYAGVLQWIAGFSINDSLLYFIPHAAARTRTWIRSSILLVGGVSTLMMAILLGIDAAMGGTLLKWFAAPLVLYVLAFANFDFWEGLWLATGRVKSVLVYSSARLFLRMAAVVTAAALWRDAQVVAWVLVGTECARLAGSMLAWHLWDRRDRQAGLLAWMKEQWKFCVSTGLSSLVIVLNRNLGALLIARMLGTTTLARFTVATYPEPVVGGLSKAVYTVTLPEMVRRRQEVGNAGLEVWKRSVSWICAAILPCLAMTLVMASDLIFVAFGEEYVPATPLLQAFLLVMARNAFDFTIPLRAIGETRPLMWCNAGALLVNAAALIVLMPPLGALGVVFAFALSMAVEPLLLAPLVAKRYEQSFSQLLHWGELGRLAVGCAAATFTVLAVRELPLGPIPFLALATAAGGLVYLSVLAALRANVIKVLAAEVRARLRKRR